MSRSVLSEITSDFLERNTQTTVSIDACLLLDFEEWYRELENFTMRSVILPLDKYHAQAITLKHAAMEDREMVLPISDNAQQLLDDLCKQLDEEIREKFPMSCFVKLNSRSPKDYAYSEDNEKTKALFVERLKILQESSAENLENRIVCEFLQTQVDSLRVEGGGEALKLLCNSKRTNIDLERCIALSRNIQEFPAKIVLREFVRIAPQWEFRGFVYKHKLTAISQYFDFAYFEDLNHQKEETKRKLLKFYENNIAHKLEHDSFVIDFGIDNLGNIYVIELNPFMQGTGTALFSWKIESDRNILLGKHPFEFRILTAPKPNPMEYLLPRWRELASDII